MVRAEKAFHLFHRKNEIFSRRDVAPPALGRLDSRSVADRQQEVGVDFAIVVTLVAGVTGILTAFTALLSELRKWRKPRPDRERKS
jgi:hypothetical protein